MTCADQSQIGGFFQTGPPCGGQRVIGRIAAALYGRSPGENEMHMGFEIDAPRKIGSCGKFHIAAAGLSAGIDCLLDGGGILGFAIAGRAKIGNAKFLRRLPLTIEAARN